MKWVDRMDRKCVVGCTVYRQEDCMEGAGVDEGDGDHGQRGSIERQLLAP